MRIGNRIKEVLFEQGHNACWLAREIPCERSNVYHIFKRDDIGVELLMKISRILNHDFFMELSESFAHDSDDTSCGTGGELSNGV